ncbi:MAG TPA: hypothetical protein VIB01_04840 [Steroidobacteraceae bacterium]|jgi:hypothetical protein
MKIRTRIIPALAATMLAAAASAQETTFSVSAGATHSDNVGRTAANEQSDTIAEAGMQLGWAHDGRLDADVTVNARYLSYLDDTFDDELVGGLNGRLVYAFLPDRFTWTVEDDFGQSFIDPRDVETPANRQNLNVFSTGPTLILPLGSRTQVSVSGRWSDVNYEESELDSERLLGMVALSRAMSDTSSLSLNLSSQRVEFDASPPNSDYDLHSAWLRYQVRGSRTTIEVSGGMTSLHDFGERSDGPLFDLTLTREVGARSSLFVNIGTRFYDAADSFVRDRGFQDILTGNEDAVPARDPFQQDYANLSWTIEGARSTLELSSDWRDEEREVDATFDRESIGVGLELSRRIGPRTTASVFGRHTSEDFSVSGVDFDEWSAGAGLDWSLSATVALGLRAEHAEGSGDTSAGTGTRDYDENRMTLRFTYSPRN